MSFRRTGKRRESEGAQSSMTGRPIRLTRIWQQAIVAACGDSVWIQSIFRKGVESERQPLRKWAGILAAFPETRQGECPTPIALASCLKFPGFPARHLNSRQLNSRDLLP